MSERLHILIVEDNPADADLMRDALPEMGPLRFHCEFVSRLSEALARLATGGIDLVLTDLGLPDSQGLATFRKLRQAAPDLAIIVLTVNDDVEAAVAAVREGAQDFLLKGQFDGNLLVRAVRYALERKQAARMLEQLNRKLDLKNRELEWTLYVASHDLWSPLVNLKGFSGELDQACRTIRSLVAEARSVDELREQLATTLNEVVPRAVEFIGAGVKKMDTLLAGLLRLSRLGQAAIRLEPLEMNAMLTDITKASEFQIREKGCTVQVGALPPCFGDATQINQVFSNLLDNALKYLAPARSGAIRVHGQQEKDWTTYCVEDNGIGIAPEDQDRVFEVFHRVHPEGPVTGEGLGLPTVRRILDRHGGTIRLESKPEKGSRFFVSLPTEAKQFLLTTPATE